MGVRGQIDREAVKRLLDKGMKYGDIASEIGCSYKTVCNVANELGMTKRQPNHKEAVPWTLGAAHKKSVPAQYMRELSRLAQGERVSAHTRATVIRWAQAIVSAGQDIAYDPAVRPNEFCIDGGFYLVHADNKRPLGTHIGRLLDRAMRGEGGE
ncbi:hypothetical protein [Microtetraspora malaysiensis]|uniref:hypothetical protein n=1 Tax=Microtetraspora malaysiensis TaxID=161358 RepID=UPI003D92912F